MKDKTGKELSTSQVLGKGVNRISSIISEFVVYILHLVGCFPSHHVRRFFYRLAGVQIGKGSTIHMGARFFDPSQIKIGDDSIIGEGVLLDGRAKLTIGNHVDIASDVMIYNSEHNVQSENFNSTDESVAIGDFVFIGPRAIILPGVTIGQGSIVAAGAVVTKNVDPFTIVGGVPAKIIGERKVKDLHYKLGRARWFR